LIYRCDFHLMVPQTFNPFSTKYFCIFLSCLRILRKLHFQIWNFRIWTLTDLVIYGFGTYGFGTYGFGTYGFGFTDLSGYLEIQISFYILNLVIGPFEAWCQHKTPWNIHTAPRPWTFCPFQESKINEQVRRTKFPRIVVSLVPNSRMIAFPNAFGHLHPFQTSMRGVQFKRKRPSNSSK